MQSRILIIDDFEPSAELLRIWLSGSGYAVDLASGGRDGLALYHAARAEEREYSVIVFDLAMPEMSGFEVADAIRESGDRDTEFVIWSANIDPLGVARAAKLGIRGILPKPCDLDEIAQVVARVIKRRELVERSSS